MKLLEIYKAGTNRVRRKIWAQPCSYIRLYFGPNMEQPFWYHLFERPTQEAIGVETPQTLNQLMGKIDDDHSDDWEVYSGELDKDDK